MRSRLPIERRPASGQSPLLPLVVLASLVVASAPLAAHEYRAGDLELLHPYAPPTPPGVASAAGYLVIVNGGGEDDRLLGGSAPFASGIEIHRTTLENDVSRMRELDEGLMIPAGTTVRLDPGATHLMFTGLAEPLSDGERVPATLVFEHAGEVAVEFAIETTAGGDDAMPMDHGSMDHESMDHGSADREDVDRGSTDQEITDHEGTDHGAM